MYAMLVASALSSQFFTWRLVVGSKFEPFLLRRFKSLNACRSALVISFCPLGLLQKPRVRPQPAPVQRLPNSTVLLSLLARETITEFGVVCCQFASMGMNSVTVYSSGAIVMSTGVKRM